MISKLESLQWQAERDADTLAEYQVIIQDKARMNRAIKEAKKKSRDLDKRANAMKKASISKLCSRK